MIPLMIAGAGLGGLKTLLEEQQAGRQRDTQSEIARYSPWTGMQAQAVKDPNLVGNITQGAAAGGMMDQSMMAAKPAAPAQPASSPTMQTSPYSLMGDQSMGSAGSMKSGAPMDWEMLRTYYGIQK